MANYLLIALFTLSAVLLFYLGFSYHTGCRVLSVAAGAPADDHQYWKAMTKKLKISFFTGSGGSLLAALSLALRRPLPAEIGCVTLLAAMVFGLALLCRKTAFRPCEETLKLQRRWKTILLVFSFAALLLTQLVFQYFLSL